MARSFNDNLDEFLDQTIDLGGESLPTRIELVPEGEYRGTVVGITPRRFQNDDGEWRAIVELMFSIDDPEVKEDTGLDDPRARYTIFLDTPKDWDGVGNPPIESARNKNIGLARLLEGFGMNDGRKFKWSDFMHNEAWIRVQKPRNPEQAMFSDVAAIGKDQDAIRRSTRGKR